MLSIQSEPNVTTGVAFALKKGRRRPVETILAGLAAATGLGLAGVILTSPSMQWLTVLNYLDDPRILAGVRLTIFLTIASMVVGLFVGLIIGLMRLSPNWILKATAGVWIWFFRGVPPLVQLLFWYNLAAFLPQIKLGLPFLPPIASWNTNEVMTPLLVAIIGLALVESGYAAEIFRGGIVAVPRGQREAAGSLGFTGAQAMRRIVLPQALRIIAPPIGNQLISMLKFTSLVSVLAISELLYSSQQIYSYTFETIPLLMVATIWYLVLTTIASVMQSWLERKLDIDATGGI